MMAPREPAVIAVRHAPVALQGICYGRLDVEPELSIRGAADTIEGALIGFEPRQIWSSPLLRCRGPAAELARRLGVPHAVDERLLEIAYGAWEGRSWAEIERDDAAAYAAWMRDWQHAGPPGGEAALDVEARVRSWWSELSPSHGHLLVGHAGVIIALRVVTGGTPWLDAMSAPVPYLQPERFRLPAGRRD